MGVCRDERDEFSLNVQVWINFLVNCKNHACLLITSRKIKLSANYQAASSKANCCMQPITMDNWNSNQNNAKPINW